MRQFSLAKLGAASAIELGLYNRCMAGSPLSSAWRPLLTCAAILASATTLPKSPQSQDSGTILPFQKARVGPAVKESTRVFNPQINISFKKQADDDGPENLPPPIEIRPPGEGNTLPL